jgi:glyoxylase-like metal-dependent hydrolase (beta-lactamase superfamily II)
MTRTRTVILGILAALLVPLTVGGGVVIWALMDMPPTQGERVRGPDGLVGRQASGSYVWFVPSDNGVVLVDAGLDPLGDAIERERGGRDVQAVLLTHAHADHTAGLSALDGVPVYLAATERPLLAGETTPEGWLARWFSAAAPPLDPMPTDLHEVADGETVEVDGLRFHAVSLPGHTPGSTAWLWRRVLFTGDAVLGGPEPMVPGPAFSGDPEQARASLRSLLPLDFEWIADGHVGLTAAARSALHRMLGEEEATPELTLSSEPPPVAGGSERVYGGMIEREATYVVAPVADRQGRRPAELWLADGTRWRLSDMPVPGHEAYADRVVTVRGRPYAEPGSAHPVRITRFELEDIALAAGQTASPEAGAAPRVTSLPTLEGRVGRWQTVSGELVALAPLSLGSTWGEGRLRLDDGAEVPIAMPLGPGEVGQTVTVLARALGGPGGVQLAVAEVCAGDVPRCPADIDG